jgi:hypothetical protein
MKRGFLNTDTTATSKSKDRVGTLRDYKAIPNHFRVEDRVGITKNSGTRYQGVPSPWGQQQRGVAAAAAVAGRSIPPVARHPNEDHQLWVRVTSSEPDDSMSDITACQSERTAPTCSMTDAPTTTSNAAPANDELSVASMPVVPLSNPPDERPSHTPHAENCTSSTTSTASLPNPFLGQPFLPTKTMGVPKAALSGWYGQKPRCHQLSKDQFVCWNDGGMPHQLKFTCIFVCPLTGELFASARYGDPDAYHVRRDSHTGADVVWYSKCVHMYIYVYMCVCVELASNPWIRVPSLLSHSLKLSLSLSLSPSPILLIIMITITIIPYRKKDDSRTWCCGSCLRLFQSSALLWHIDAIGSFGGRCTVPCC